MQISSCRTAIFLPVVIELVSLFDGDLKGQNDYNVLIQQKIPEKAQKCSRKTFSFLISKRCIFNTKCIIQVMFPTSLTCRLSEIGEIELKRSAHKNNCIY